LGTDLKKSPASSVQRLAIALSVTWRSLRDHRRLVEQYAVQLRMGFQDRREQSAMTATDVHERVELGELIGFRDRRIGQAGGRFMKNREIVWVLLKILEHRHAMRLGERHLAGDKTRQQVLPGVPLPVGIQHRRRGAHRARHAGLQGRGQRCQLELAILRLGKDPDAGERAQHAVKLGRAHAGSLRQLLGRARATFEKVGQLQRRGDLDETRDPVPDDEVQHCLVRRRFLGHGTPGCSNLRR